MITNYSKIKWIQTMKMVYFCTFILFYYYITELIYITLYCNQMSSSQFNWIICYSKFCWRWTLRRFWPRQMKRTNGESIPIMTLCWVPARAMLYSEGKKKFLWQIFRVGFISNSRRYHDECIPMHILIICYIVI